MGHKHHELMTKYAELAKVSKMPWVYFEKQELASDNFGFEWVPCTSAITWSSGTEYRLKDIETDNVEASLKWELDSKCPMCGGVNDLSESPHDDEGEFSHKIFNNKWSDCAGSEVTCEHCAHEYSISEVIQ